MKIKFATLLFSIVCMMSCTKDNDTNTTSSDVNIRLSNKSEIKFENATYNGVNFGDIEPGETTNYKVFDSSYSYGSVSVKINNENYGWVPIDFVGEELLDNGNYTFEYNFNDEKLTDKLIRD